MDNLINIVWLLPIVFMMHDFEEIIFFKPWIKKNSLYLKDRFPSLAKYFLPRFENLSVSAFSLAVFEEFILFSLITVTAIYFEFYAIWLAVFMAFSIHLVVHIIQWIIIRRYIPTIVTSFLALPYCIYGFKVVLESQLFTGKEIVLYAAIGIILMGVNLFFAHKLAAIYNDKSKDLIE